MRYAHASHLGLGQNQLFHIFGVRHVGHCEFHSEFRRDFLKITIRTAVHVIATQHVIAGLQQLDHGRGGGQTGREGQTVFGTIQGSYAVL